MTGRQFNPLNILYWLLFLWLLSGLLPFKWLLAMIVIALSFTIGWHVPGIERVIKKQWRRL